MPQLEKRAEWEGWGFNSVKRILVLPEITGGLHNKLIIQGYIHLLVINNFSLIKFGEMRDKMS